MGFMDYLKDIDNNITSVEDFQQEKAQEVKEVVMEQKEAFIPASPKDATVELLEYRLKDKLDDIGLSSKLISEVVETVLGDIGSVKEEVVAVAPPKPRQKEPEQVARPKQPEPTPQQPKAPVQVQETMMSRAESILEGVPAPVARPQQDMGVPQQETHTNLSGVADHASALL